MPASDIVEQFTQRYSDHHNQEHNRYSEECPKPFAENIFLQNIQGDLIDPGIDGWD